MTAPRLTPYPVNTQPSTNLLHFRSELHDCTYTSDDLPTFEALVLNALENETAAIISSIEVQLDGEGNDERWRHNATMKLNKTLAFRNAIARERGRRNSALKLAQARALQGKSRTRAECELIALRRILNDYLDPSDIGRIFARGKSEGGRQFHQIRKAVDDLDVADGYF